MKLLRWIARDKLLYAIVSAIILLLVSTLVGWQINQKLTMDRELPLSLALGKLLSTIEGGTTNSQAMGAAILFGLENKTSKQLLQNTNPSDNESILQEMNTLRWQFLAKSAMLINQQAEVVAYAADDKQLTRGSRLTSWPAAQMALHGTANVYPSKQDRVIYLAAPVRESHHNKSKAIGAFLIGIDGQKLDVVFDAWNDDGIAALISPNGEVFSASRHEWIKTQPEASSLSRDNKPLKIDGVSYSKHYMPLEWHDPAGEWRLLVLSQDVVWWQSGLLLGLTSLIFLSTLLLLWTIFTLVRHEEELLNNELQLKEAQHIAAMCSYVLDIPNSYFKVSDETYALFGLAPNFVTTLQSWLTLVHPADRDMLMQHLQQEVLQQGLAFNKEYRIIRANDQAERWMHGMGQLETDKQGRYIRLHGTVQDITENKNIEIKLRQEHEQSQHYLDTTLAIMVKLDEQGNISMLNRTACSLLGYQEHELLGRNWFASCLPQPYGCEVVYPIFLQIMAGERKSAGEFENSILCRDGSLRLVAWRNTVHTNDQGKITGTLSSGIDVTESRKLSQQLTTILEKSPTGIAVFNTTGACVIANSSYANLLGASQEQVLQQNFREKTSWQQYGLLALAEQALATRQTVRQDIEGVSSFGKHFAVECIFSAVDLSGEQHLMLLINDVSARMMAERALNESLIKLEEKELSKTRFLAAAGHDLRQPIAAANLFVNSLKYSHPSAQQYALIRRLEQSMNVFSSLLECLLDISKLDAGLIQPQMESVPLNEVFGWLDHIFSEVAYHKKLRFLFFFPKNHEIFIQTDRELLKTILMNLVSNALKFTTQGGILVSARVRANKVLLQVWDTGIGIAEANLPHIFEEFYQVSNPQRNRESGLGLGLASCQRRMALLGGKVTCKSRLNKGSVFSLSLQLNHEQANTNHEIYPTNTKPLGNLITGKKIVVLEDDKLLSDATATLLQAMGAQVRLFSTAEQALQESNILDTDYFIVDYGLGGKLTGLQFLQQLQQQSIHQINAVLVTGETSSSFLSSTANSPWPVLYKPIDINKLTNYLVQQDR